MIKQELLKTLKSKVSLSVFLYLLLIAVGDTILGISQTGKNGSLPDIHPTYISLLSGQSGLVFYALFFWISPVVIIILYSARYIFEYKNKTNLIYVTKIGRRNYFFSKIIVSFLLPTIYFSIPLLLNLLIYFVFLNGGNSFVDMDTYDWGKFINGCFGHPYFAWFGYFFVALIVLGLLGVFCQCIIIIVNDYRIGIAFSFACWMVLYSTKYNMTNIIEPFTEFGLDYALKSFCIYFSMVIISFVLALFSVVRKKDEV